MRNLSAFLVTLGLLAGCAAVQESAQPAASVTPEPFLTSTPAAMHPSDMPSAPTEPAAIEGASLATPVAGSPAAGICGGWEGATITVTIYPDVPDPRCAIVRPDQWLIVVNRRNETVQVSLAGLTTSLAPGEEHLFEVAFGRILAPGVHRIEVSPCCGAELWLQEGP